MQSLFSNANSIPMQDEDAPLVKDQDEDLFIIDQTAQDFLEYKAAECEDYNSRLLKENEVLFTPSILTGNPTTQLCIISCIFLLF